MEKGMELENAKKGFPTIGRFISEVFGEQESRMYDWLSQAKFSNKSRYVTDKKVMIVTGEHGSGKTTFLEIVKALFAYDGVEVQQWELLSDYNSHWITKSMVCIDGVSFDKIQFNELIKTKVNSVLTRVSEKNKTDTAIRPKLNFLLVTNDLEGAKNLVSENKKAFIIETTGEEITPSPKEFLADENNELSLMAEDELNRLIDYLYINFQK